MNKNDQPRKSAQINTEADKCLLAGDHQKALKLYLKNADTFAVLQDYNRQAGTLSNVGLIEAGMGLNEDALAHYKKALALFERQGKKLQMAEMWGNIGSTYRNMEAYDKAMEAYSEALPLYEGIDHKGGIADQYTNMAYVHTQRGEMEDAINFYQKALPIYENSGDSRRIEVTTQNLQTLVSSMGKATQ